MSWRTVLQIALLLTFYGGIQIAVVAINDARYQAAAAHAGEQSAAEKLEAARRDADQAKARLYGG